MAQRARRRQAVRPVGPGHRAFASFISGRRSQPLRVLPRIPDEGSHAGGPAVQHRVHRPRTATPLRSRRSSATRRWPPCSPSSARRRERRRPQTVVDDFFKIKDRQSPLAPIRSARPATSASRRSCSVVCATPPWCRSRPSHLTSENEPGEVARNRHRDRAGGGLRQAGVAARTRSPTGSRARRSRSTRAARCAGPPASNAQAVINGQARARAGAGTGRALPHPARARSTTRRRSAMRVGPGQDHGQRPHRDPGPDDDRVHRRLQLGGHRRLDPAAQSREDPANQRVQQRRRPDLGRRRCGAGEPQSTTRPGYGHSPASSPPTLFRRPCRSISSSIRTAARHTSCRTGRSTARIWPRASTWWPAPQASTWWGSRQFQPHATSYAALAKSVAQTGANCVMISALTESGAPLLARQIGDGDAGGPDLRLRRRRREHVHGSGVRRDPAGARYPRPGDGPVRRPRCRAAIRQGVLRRLRAALRAGAAVRDLRL